MKKNKLSGRILAAVLLFGITGQLAWTIENMYLNLFVFNTIIGSPTVIAAMVAASAACATITTLLMGALSDRLGKRKIFMAGGYVLWGLSTLAFAFINVENVSELFPLCSAAMTAAVFVIILDCVMTFFGSTANDAALNAYVTDVTCTDNRGRVESALAILPLLSMLIIFGGFDSMTQKGNWKGFFLIFGLLMIAVGLAGFFLIKEPKITKDKQTSYLKNIVYGMRPSVVKAHPMLYLSLCTFAVFAIATQIFFPYLIIYLQSYLKMDNYALLLGIVLISAAVISLIFGRIIDKVGKLKFILPAAAVMTVGLTAMFFVRSFATVIIAGIVMMGGYMLVTAAAGALIRDYTPPDKAGMFQGIRMVFAVLLPMVTGPYIGAAVIRGNSESYTELGVTKQVPTPEIFLASALFMFLIIIPVLVLIKQSKNSKTE